MILRPSRRRAAGLSGALGIVIALVCASLPAQAQKVSNEQRERAEQVADHGIPVSELAPNAPEHYTVQRGDTLWGISRLFLKSPWRWPDLWGMNLAEIRNPHRIFPGQDLYLERRNGRALLRSTPPAPQAAVVAVPATSVVTAPEAQSMPTVRLSPRTRATPLPNQAIPPLPATLIEPFLVEPLVVEAQALRETPRIVALAEGRVLIARGDRVYVRGEIDIEPPGPRDRPPVFRIFRNATPLIDPDSREILGYEAPYIGRAEWVRPESVGEFPAGRGRVRFDTVPATFDIIGSKEEIRIGDRLLPEPAREYRDYVPHAPTLPVQASVVSIYGSAVAMAGQRQVILLNKGSDDGLEVGHVMALLKAGARVVDRTDPARPVIRLPDERNGLVMVFRTFERVSYALVLEISDGVRVGDRLINPR